MGMETFEGATGTGVNRALPNFRFDNSYARLPDRFFARVAPAPVPAPRLIKLNTELARQLGLDPAELESADGVQVLAGNAIAPGAEPLAMAYAGHQFGHFVPQLGDGRANLIGEVIGRNGLRYDIQLKGSGPTPFSRRGDGRAALGPVLREYIVSEAMAALGVPTTRALAAVTTGAEVMRERPLPGAVLVRVAASHLRVGSFQYFAAQRDTEALLTLTQYAIARHYPDVLGADQPVRAFLASVVKRQALLVARWMTLGFIHGVMNTDNTSISGETIDYGPCAFMEAFEPGMVFSSIDMQGRYAYGNQPHSMLWNLTRLAEALLPLLQAEAGGEEAGVAAAQAVLGEFASQFEAAQLNGFRRKLGLATEAEGDLALVQDLLERMAANQADFTLTFRRLADAAEDRAADAQVRALFRDPAAYDAWAETWRARVALDSTEPEVRAAGMRSVSPLFIPRNHLVEAVIDAAVEKEDFEPFEELVSVLVRPYEYRPALDTYAAPARPEEMVRQTFCGT